MSVITLTTDFGTRDWFVGTMKGVIAGLAPGAQVFDITHDIPAGDIRAGAFALSAAAPFFPEGTVHVAVVDPGVGSKRKAIAVRSKNATFIGPDNGVLSWALREAGIDEIRFVENETWFVHPVSNTFHGRDVFAPVAARFAAGARFEEAGDQASDMVKLRWPDVQREDRALRGEVIYVDRFGNAITNVATEDLPAENDVVVRSGDISMRLIPCYADGAENEPIAVSGSSGFLELAINGSRFALTSGVTVGTAIEVSW